MHHSITSSQIAQEIKSRLQKDFGTTPQDAPDAKFYRAAAGCINAIINQKRSDFNEKVRTAGTKQVHYLCMEFLMGRSLKNNLYSLGLTEKFEEALRELGVDPERIYDQEPDAGLGNGGLGRLAACFLDALASGGYAASGYSILYEYGIFRQKIVDGWQTELPDNWLPGGDVWLVPRPDEEVKVHFDGRINDYWDAEGFHVVEHIDYHTVRAVPYDMMVPGYGDSGVAVLRLWSAEPEQFDMTSFNSGNFQTALERSAEAEVISKVLYPSDNHMEGKSLRLRQQYFLVSASTQDIVSKHAAAGYTIDSLPKQAAIHINDTHPALVIPELMRILMDDCGYSWDTAYSITTRTVAYTNHTVMSEALEKWPVDLFSARLPRIWQIVRELDRRYRDRLIHARPNDPDRVERMAIISNGQVNMANLCCAVCHSVNGVSALHTDILRQSVFSDFYSDHPERFCNVTNGIAYRRWLCQSNPRLTGLLTETIGDTFITDASRLADFSQYSHDKTVLKRLAEIKRANKMDFSDLLVRDGLAPLDPDSIFDVQVKRLHEYKRQLLNALHILSLYLDIKEGRSVPKTPHTFLFGAKAAPGYYMAKQIIRFISNVANLVNNDPQTRDLLRVVFLEDYRVTLAQSLMPSADVSEQISLAGTEASGTGNMKLMINGALTLGTLDGANVEIVGAVGEQNAFLFGMKSEEVDARRAAGYHPSQVLSQNARLRALLDYVRGMDDGYCEILCSLTERDFYMVLADFDSYCEAQQRMCAAYTDATAWNRMSLMNIAMAGRFSADRSISEYAKNIWGAAPIK